MNATYGEERTVCRLEGVGNEICLVRMMEGGDGELEFVGNAHEIVEIDSLVAMRMNLRGRARCNELELAVDADSCYLTLTRPRRTSTKASHWSSSGYSPSPAQSPLVAFVQYSSCASLICRAFSYLSTSVRMIPRHVLRAGWFTLVGKPTQCPYGCWSTLGLEYDILSLRCLCPFPRKIHIPGFSPHACL